MSKPGGDPSSGISSGDVLILTERHPACRRREARLGSCTERENLHGDAKGKGTSGASCEAESTDAPVRGGLLRSSDEAGVMPVERREQAIAIWIGSTGNGRNPIINGRRQPSCGGASRMNREVHVRFCEGLGVKCPGPTRQSRQLGYAATSAVHPTPDVSLPRNEPTLRARSCREQMQQKLRLFHHLVCGDEQHLRNCQAERFCGLKMGARII